ncbi:mannosyl-glycoprotein endo-beta-N-acetylglucosamidase [Paenibacillus sp. HJL G12]|uniref:Mannosyl-glycoprotein endo-beta-N-acetylglucosamidase n=1 Tax=Paenibacillus dendrobii TaxID=2691084 RepID=A0A7X3LIH6_9BACL|nr:glucosaminidase domain-containing protein [Paenibacillus dendrobii]MWV44573.1 mannosyl-glycoprotein endo-beta-N-acetylglucosamidase [Paenibacillus dendrobii]
MNKNEFISTLTPCAISDMQRCGIPASLTIAQAILESNWGTSGLTQQANNLFGIKGKGPAGSVDMPTTEYVQGKPVKVTASFRKYRSWAESVADHSNLILGGTRDNPTRYHGVLNANYKTAAEEIWKGGYATDPQYPAKLIAIMEAYNLSRYDSLKGDAEEMEKAELQQQLQALTKRVEDLQGQLSQLAARDRMPIPVWAESAVKTAVAKGIIDTPDQCSYDFYRMLALFERLKLL